MLHSFILGLTCVDLRRCLRYQYLLLLENGNHWRGSINTTACLPRAFIQQLNLKAHEWVSFSMTCSMSVCVTASFSLRMNWELLLLYKLLLCSEELLVKTWTLLLKCFYVWWFNRTLSMNVQVLENSLFVCAQYI